MASTETKLILPASAEAERAILGSVLLDGEKCLQVVAELAVDDFSLDSHRVLFRRISAMHTQKRAVDSVSLVSQLYAHDEVDSVGGPLYLSQLTDDLPRFANIDHWIRIVKEHAARRTLYHVANAIGRRALDNEDPEQIIQDAQEKIRAVRSADGRGLVTFAEAFDKQFGSVDTVVRDWERMKGLDTGFERFDRMTFGLQKGDLVIIAARPSLGKTSLAMNIIANVAIRGGKPAAMISLEMSLSSVMLRFMCAEASVDSNRLKGGFLSREENTRLAIATGRLRTSPIIIDDFSYTTTAQIHASAKRYMTKGGIALLVVDYLQLMEGPKKENRTQQISAISRGLKELAKDLNIPVIAVAQLNRGAEDRDGAPRLSDLRESGQIEQDADVVAFLWHPTKAAGKVHPSSRAAQARQDQRKPGDPIPTELAIAKHRNGPVGSVPLMFLPGPCRFYEVEQFGEQQEGIA